MESDDRFLVDDKNHIRYEYVVNSDNTLDEENSSDSTNKNLPLREQDRFLPIANIMKIMKRGIPENGKITKDARECLQECLSEFISFITSEASDRCQIEKRKTINGEDILFALHNLGFDNYVSPIKLYLKKYREIVLAPVTNQESKTTVRFGDNNSLSESADNGNEVDPLLTYPKMEFLVYKNNGQL